MTIYGYARVSTEDQNLDQQVAELKAAGCNMIRHEKVSGKSTAGRDQLALLLEFMHEGDTLIVSKLDRLARNTLDMLQIITDLGARGITFKSLAESWADTTSAANKLMLHVMAGIAEFERDRMKERQRAGIDRAKANGERRDNGALKYAGRPAKLDRAAIAVDLAAGMKPAHVARKHGVSRFTVYEVKGAQAEAIAKPGGVA
jgi:DNA invertase Pin-like site-specific DNA recombinase